jgi:hypothetical protein
VPRKQGVGCGGVWSGSAQPKGLGQTGWTLALSNAVTARKARYFVPKRNQFSRTWTKESCLRRAEVTGSSAETQRPAADHLGTRLTSRASEWLAGKASAAAIRGGRTNIAGSDQLANLAECDVARDLPGIRRSAREGFRQIFGLLERGFRRQRRFVRVDRGFDQSRARCGERLA